MTGVSGQRVAAGAAIFAALGLAGYLASCAGTAEPAGASDRPIKLVALSEQLAPLPELPPPPPPPPPEPPRKSVVDVLDSGCSTVVVKALSEQIIAEGNCIQPGAYGRVPKLANVTLGEAVFPYMRKPARDALVKAAKSGKRYKMKINSMLRTVAQQYLLYDWYKRGRCGIKLAAEPGTSNHQGGLAIDISSPGTWRKILQRHGFRWLGKRDRWHFDYTARKLEKFPGLDVKAFQRLHNRNHPDDAISDDGEWGESTEKALRRAPVEGYELGPQCAPEAD